MLLHAFGGGAGEILAAAAGEDLAGAGLLSAVSMCFALGAATIEQFKHLAAAEVRPLAGLPVLPDLRMLRPRLAAIADRTDPLALQRLFASAMLAADPVVSGVYYVDDHFVPYAGAKPAGKGWNNKRGKAEKGRADTYTSPPMTRVGGELRDRRAVRPERHPAEGAGGAEEGRRARRGDHVWASTGAGRTRRCSGTAASRACTGSPTACAPLAAAAMLPVITTITIAGLRWEITWAEETADIKDYGQARQLTLFEHGKVVLQILTSDLDACPAEILAWLKSRWREENFLKYASQNYGIDKICDYLADISANTKIIDNPARKKAVAAVREAEKALAGAERDLARLLADPAISPAAKNSKLIPAAEKKITAARTKLDAAA